MSRFNLLRSFTVVLLFTSFLSFAREEEELLRNESCTSIMFGKEATEDGSVITAHTCDGYYRTWLNFVPAQKFQTDTTHNVYWGSMHTYTPESREGMVLKGAIPEAKETYAYLNTAYPCLNEKQLAIGETTISGKKELINKNGLFLIEELERVALQRCSSAREAIKLIGELIKEYGYADNGECITIADKKEVWQLEIFGEGPNKIGGVWAAQRIPDNHVGISANISRIGELNLKDKNYFMASDNVFEVAKKLGYWNGKETFKFWKAYSGKKPFLVREYFVLSSMAPSLNLQYDSEELPFSVEVEKKVSIRDVAALYKQTYDGTEFEMIRNLEVEKKIRNQDGGWDVVDTIISPAAHPWLSTDRRDLLNSLKKDAVVRERPISVQYCSYSWIAQLRDDLPDEIGGKIWFGFDVPQLSPRVPIYCGNLSLPDSYNICGHKHFSRQSALWAFTRTNRLAMVNWGIGKEVVLPEVKKYEDKVFGEVDFIEQQAIKLLEQDNKNAKDGEATKLCREFLTNYSNASAHSTINRWWELGDELWVKVKWKF
jgi:dipeptidase